METPPEKERTVHKFLSTIVTFVKSIWKKDVIQCELD